jgi:cytochrome P450
VARKCLDNTVLLDRFIPRGSLVSVYIKGIHLNPSYHPSPHQFNPDRFDHAIKPGTFLPFGDGKSRFEVLER